MNNATTTQPTNATPSLFPDAPPSTTVSQGWCIAFGLLAVAIILGNFVVVAALLNMKFLRRARKYFLVSLSAADLLVGAVALPMYVYLVYPTRDNRNITAESKQRMQLFTHAYQATDIFSGLASAFTLTVISLEHTFAIWMPLQHRGLQKSTYILLIGIAWTLAGIISVAYLLSYVGGLIHHTVFTYSMTILSCFSVVIICVAYTALWFKVKCVLNKNRIGKRMLGGAIHERNLFKALAIVTFVFVFTWLPFHIMNIIANFRASLLQHVGIDVICFTKLLHYSNSCINPIIYSLKLPEFRASVRGIFAKLMCFSRAPLRETRL